MHFGGRTGPEGSAVVAGLSLFKGLHVANKII